MVGECPRAGVQDSALRCVPNLVAKSRATLIASPLPDTPILSDARKLWSVDSVVLRTLGCLRDLRKVCVSGNISMKPPGLKDPIGCLSVPIGVHRLQMSHHHYPDRVVEHI